MRDETDDLRCGWGRFTPSCLQCCHKSVVLLAVMSLLAMLQGIVVNGMVSTSISNLERRFDLQSSQTGVIASSYDIGYLLVVILVSYYGGIGHKGRWLGWGTALMGVGSVVFALPQFISDNYVIGQQETTLCTPGNITVVEKCSEETDYRLHYALFVIGQLLHGIGCAPMYTLGYTYLDENVLPHHSAIFTGIFFSTSAIGPAIGYLLSGYFLTLYGDIGFVDLDDVQIENDDPRWYGAWWIGFILIAALAFVAAVLMLAFAKELPGSKEKQKFKHNEADARSGEHVVSAEGFGKTLRDLPIALKHLLLNPTYMCFMLGGSLDNFLVNGFITFFPKYIEHQFGMTASDASFYGGLIVVLGVCVGSLGCAIAISYLKMSCLQILRLTVVAIFLSLFGFVAFRFSCTTPPYVGVTQDYVNGSSAELISGCNLDCQCSVESYEPVCVDNSELYFSPCHAGCQTDMGNDTFTSCSCAPSDSSILHISSSEVCQSGCSILYVFLALIFYLITLTMMASISVVQIILRIVPFSQRSLAMGLGWVFGRILGSIPGPIAMGSLIDLTCDVWGEKCDKKTSCVVYDNPGMRINFLVLPVCVRVTTFILLVIGLCLYKPAHTSESDTTVSRTETEDASVDSAGPMKDDNISTQL